MKTAIHTKTQEQFDKVLEIFENKEWTWSAGEKPTELKYYWDKHKKETCIYYNNNFEYSGLEYYKARGLNIISFEDFLKEEGIYEIKPGDLVGVSDKSQDIANKNFGTFANPYYIGKTKDGKYVVEHESGYIITWNYISNKKPKEETIKIKSEDGETIEIEKEKAIELGFNIKD